MTFKGKHSKVERTINHGKIENIHVSAAVAVTVVQVERVNGQKERTATGEHAMARRK